MRGMMRALLTLGMAAGLMVGGCSGDGDPEPDEATGSTDATEQTDNTDGTETTDGAVVPTLPTVPAPPALPELCNQIPPEPIAWPMDATRVSLSVYHFNLQYVAGGLVDYFGWTATEEEIEDLIITESFEPLIDLFERHPGWGGSFEMQGLMLEIMAERHSEVLQRFWTLVKRGQVDLMTFHWSDQLVVAYPRKHMDWSWEENDRLLQAMCMPRAKAHFLQEGQFGPGISAYVAEKDGGTMVLPRNLAKMFVDPPPSGLVHENDGHKVLLTNGAAGDGLELGWNFVDDGELLATGDLNPYLLSEFKHDPEYLKSHYEDKLQVLEDTGWTIAPISHYLAILKDRQIDATPLGKTVLDGSWQPKDSGNMFLWMGGGGQSPGDERDNQLLTTNIRAGRLLAAAEWLLKTAEGQGVDVTEARKVFRHAVRELLRAEVSDTTGWRPVKTEIAYGLTHQKQAIELGTRLGEWLLYEMGHRGTVEVDAWAGEVRAGATPTPEAAARPSAPPSLSGVTLETERPFTMTWSSVGAEYVVLTIDIPATDETTEGSTQPPTVKLTLPLKHDTIAYSPALTSSGLLTAPLQNNAFVTAGHRMGLPLSNGLLGLDDSLTLVLDLESVHLAASLEPGKVVFEDRVLPAQDAVTWRMRFYFEDASAVVAAAGDWNHRRPTVFELPAAD